MVLDTNEYCIWSRIIQGGIRRGCFLSGRAYFGAAAYGCSKSTHECSPSCFSAQKRINTILSCLANSTKYFQMPTSSFADRVKRLAAEGRKKYIGTAQVNLEVLHFPWSQHREFNQKSLDKLKKCFKEGQCDRATRNRIPALIDQSELNGMLRESNLSAESLLKIGDNPHCKLKFPARYQLTCLHGRHRIQAAREALPPRERWWIVDLYLAGKLACLLKCAGRS